jgi:hypothetical protein
MTTYSIDLVKIPKDVYGISEAIIDDETGETVFVVGENRALAERLVEFMNRMERLENADK